jgi:hypothetical protein
LTGLTAEFEERFRLSGTRHAFCDYGKTEFAREVQNAADDCAAVKVPRQVLHKRSVDLELVDGKAFDGRERREPSAKIIEGKAYPSATKCSELPERSSILAQSDLLRQFEFKVTGRKPMPL